MSITPHFVAHSIRSQEVELGAQLILTFDDDLEVVCQHLEGRYTAAVLGYHVLLVVGTAGVLEKVFARIRCLIHRSQQGGS